IPFILRVLSTSLYVSLSFSFVCHGVLRHLHSFPPRRSSDLAPVRRDHANIVVGQIIGILPHQRNDVLAHDRDRRVPVGIEDNLRSEEHTSELQSREKLVCRLLLEKKKARYMSPNPRAVEGCM